MNKTLVPPQDPSSRQWYLVDAENQTLGRLASEVASVLRGKNNPNFAPHIDAGDFVVVINAEKVKVSGNKFTQKVYRRHSGRPGGMKTESFAALQARLPEGEELEATEYYAKLYEKMDLLEMPRNFTSRAVNEGFSGGEKKRCEILQMAMLQPTFALLDETDSGLDIDALKIVSHGVNSLRGPDTGMLVITHYQRLLDYIVPDVVHVMVNGRIVESGTKELALKLEAEGYDWANEPEAEAVGA